MSAPKNVFQQQRKHLKTGNLSFLTKQVAYWQQLTKLIQPLLPQPEHWQVVCYQNNVLTLSGENQAMISQLGYLQTLYISKLAQLDGLHDLQKLQVRLRPQVSSNPNNVNQVTPLPPEAKAMLLSAAEYVSDPKLSQALRRLASNKKD